MAGSFASLLASFLAEVRPLVDLGFSAVTGAGADVGGAGAVARAGTDIVGLVNRFGLESGSAQWSMPGVG
jgi:hypothetical protein